MMLAISQMVLGILIVVDFLSFGLLSGVETGSFPPGLEGERDKVVRGWRLK